MSMAETLGYIAGCWIRSADALVLVGGRTLSGLARDHGVASGNNLKRNGRGKEEQEAKEMDLCT